MQDEEIRIIVVDDHMVVRAGLSQVVASFDGIRIVGEAENGEEALFLCHKLKPDLMLMDIQMAGMGGVAATRAIREHHPDVRVLALSTFQDRAAVEQIMAARANGFILKDISAHDLEATIRQICAGETVIAPEIEAMLSVSTPMPSEPTIDLGRQQRKVLALLSKGLTNSEIATHMSISQPTARYHVSAIFLKLGVSNRAEASAMAVRHGLIATTDFD